MSLTLNTKVFTFDGIANAIAAFSNRAAGVVAGFKTVTASIRLTPEKSRVTWKAGFPVVAEEATSCACPGNVVRRLDADINVRMDPGATTAERTDFALSLKDLVASPEFQASIISLQTPSS
jgi:hypothetical protein